MVRQSPQVADILAMLQPVRTMNETPNIHSDNVVHQISKDTGSESEAETWSFDRAINEVFRLLPQELCLKSSEEHTPAKQLSGIEHLIESCATPLLVLSQSKLVENTTKFIQNKLDSENFSKEWLCPQNLVSSLAPTKYYKSQNQYFPTENLPQLEADASLFDISSRGRCSVSVRNLEFWEKRARKLVAINSHTDLFYSAAYLRLQQESMSVNALSRLLKAVAKSIKHATAMSTVLATELFQARHDAAIATSKLLFENSSYELRNAPISANLCLITKLRKQPKLITKRNSRDF